MLYCIAFYFNIYIYIYCNFENFDHILLISAFLMQLLKFLAVK